MRSRRNFELDAAGYLRGSGFEIDVNPTAESLLVNLHLGEAASFQIWADNGDAFTMVEDRKAPPAGGGGKRWTDLAETLSDCRAVLVSGVGDTPRIMLEEHGIEVAEITGFIEQGLMAAFRTGNLDALKIKSGGGCAAGGCTGSGEGC